MKIYRLSLDLTVPMYQWPKAMGFYPILSDIHCKSLYIHCVQCFNKLWRQIYLKTHKHTTGQFHALAFMHIFICIVTLAVRWPGNIVNLSSAMICNDNKSTLAFLLMLFFFFFATTVRARQFFSYDDQSPCRQVQLALF